MGNSWFCNRCDIEKFQLSRDCADQFLGDDTDTPLSSEERWRIKLKCLDDAHSKSKGLTPEAFNELADKLEKEIQRDNIPVYCKNKIILMECLEKNPNCMLNCKREMDDFIDCVDTLRVRKIKEHVQSKKKIVLKTFARD